MSAPLAAVMTARDELQQWADDACHTLAVYVDGKCYYSIDLDLVRRVLAEMDEQAAQATLTEELERIERRPTPPLNWRTDE